MFKLKGDATSEAAVELQAAETASEMTREDTATGELRLVVPGAAAGQRLDKYIGDSCPGLSRSYAASLIDAGAVMVNGGEGAARKYKMREGDEVIITIPEAAQLDVAAEDIPLQIVYEDDDLIVINKERGMVVHPAPGNETGTVVNAVLYHCGDRLSSINGVKRPGIVHRIDKDTSGLLMIAKNDTAHESLAAQLKEHSVTREYWALCCDNIREDELTIDSPIGRDERNRLRRAVNGSGAKNAVTHIRVIERFGKYTLVAARLETGRTHQIRVHLASVKHPLVGDPLYGAMSRSGRAGREMTAAYVEKYGLGQMLHAKTLGFIHPRTGEYMEFDSELPEYFRAMLESIRKR